MKYKRQSKIIQIVQDMAVHTHDELIYALDREGFKVTQATVSRDIKELGLIKVPSADGTSIYRMPENTPQKGVTRINAVSDTVKRVVSALHTVVITTMPGMASAVAATVDSALHGEILGSVAGDDTIIIVAESENGAKLLEQKIKTIFKSE